jgi:hypothetical protein
MATIENTVKERLAARQLALGLGLRQARTVDIGRILAACGYDWAFIDMEHNTMGIDTAAQIAVACHDAGVTPIVRVPGYEHYLATRLLDAGAMGIVFPHVDSAEHARTLVDNCKYPPMGHRSLGGPMSQLGFKPYPRSESSAIVNKETMLIMMLETPQGIERRSRNVGGSKLSWAVRLTCADDGASSISSLLSRRRPMIESRRSRGNSSNCARSWRQRCTATKLEPARPDPAATSAATTAASPLGFSVPSS